MICVAADEIPTKILAFTHDEVINNFTLCSFVWSTTGKLEHNCRRLDLIDGGERGLEFNVNLARKTLQFKGEPTEFEREFNRNPEPFFSKHNIDRILSLIKT